MGQCKYCGEDAGFFSHVHKECEEKHNQGIVAFEDGIRRYFRDAIKMSDLKQLSQDLRQFKYLTDPDIAISSAKCIDEYTEQSRWPFHSHQLDLVRDYIYNIGVPYQSINVNGSLDKLSHGAWFLGRILHRAETHAESHADKPADYGSYAFV